MVDSQRLLGLNWETNWKSLKNAFICKQNFDWVCFTGDQESSARMKWLRPFQLAINVSKGATCIINQVKFRRLPREIGIFFPQRWHKPKQRLPSCGAASWAWTIWVWDIWHDGIRKNLTRNCGQITRRMYVFLISWFIYLFMLNFTCERAVFFDKTHVTKTIHTESNQSINIKET